jgi:uncharacterized protein YkwD
LRALRTVTVPIISLLLFAAGLSAATSASAATIAQLTGRLATSVNTVRTAHRAVELAVNPALSRVASSHSALIAGHGQLATHYSGEAALSSLLRAQGYSPAAGLLLVASSANQDAVLRVPSAMASNTSVRRWILSAGFTQVGTSVRYAAGMHRYVLTIVLARPVTTQALWAAHVVSLLNAERSAHGLASLRANVSLISSAHAHNLAMARRDTLSHQVSGEAAYTRRISNAGYVWSYAGENIGWNSSISLSGALALETAMYNEKAPDDGHRLNILSRNFTDLGVDVYFDNVHHKLWLTEDFGRR